MSTTAQPQIPNPAPPSVPSSDCIQVCLPPLNADALQVTLRILAEAFGDRKVLVSTPDPVPADTPLPTLEVTRNSSSAPSQATLVPAAADYVNAWTAARDNHPAVIVVLGPDASSISPGTLRRLTDSVLQGRDLVVARYPMALNQGLINAAILYPLTRALFSNPLRYPLPIDVALSARMAERLAQTGQHLTVANQPAAFVWPVAEAVFARCSTCDVAGDPRTLPQPPAANLDDVLATFVGSLFSDAEAKAAFWQRAQLTGRSHPRSLAHAAEIATQPEGVVDPAPHIDAFRTGYKNFHGLWANVLPPNSLLSLKKLSLAAPDNFVLADALWARTIFDFLLAFRLRTVPRAELLTALTPLYQAWCASHILQSGQDPAKAEALVENCALAFENDKPYLIARWRWPDRFNP